MNTLFSRLAGLCLLLSTLSLPAQSFNLQQLLKDNKLEVSRSFIPLDEKGKNAVSGVGIAWLKGVTFSNGSIDIDLRGKDIFQQSFIGIAFHGVDTSHCDIVYFRPFNFRTSDSVRRIHAVQYVSEPDFTWYKLREEKNGIYEKAIVPAPLATDWFHARIEVKDDDVRVYVNYSKTPSLTVKKLNSRRNGLIGLWNTGENGAFDKLVIKRK